MAGTFQSRKHRIMAKNAKKIAVKSKNVVEKATYPKVTKKTVKSALQSEVAQNNVRAFAFPTTAGIERDLAVVDAAIAKAQTEDADALRLPAKKTFSKKMKKSAAVADKPATSKDDVTKFENLPLLCGFEHDGKHHVKVGNTTAILVPIIVTHIENVGHRGVVALAAIGEHVVTKVRLKKTVQVRPL
jgi:hypothetical protein